jgi:hypothetical protein
MNTLSRKRLVDKLVEAYVAWRETSARVDHAYRSWASGTGPRGGVAFGQYLAALDAEERAAEVYAGLVRHAERLPWSAGPAAEPLGGSASGLARHDRRLPRQPRQSPW